MSYERKESEKGNVVFRRSLYAVADVAKGAFFSETNIRSIRPGYGIAPKYLDKILGRRASRDIPRGSPVSTDMVLSDGVSE